MYTPTKQIIRSGYADVKFDGPDMDYDGWKQIVQDYKQNAEKRYQETYDLYDLQEEQAKKMDEALDGLSGTDYLYQQNDIIAKRDLIKSLYKGKSKKEIKSPEFQAQVYRIYQDLAKTQNNSKAFQEQAKQSLAWAKSNPHIDSRRYEEFLIKELSKPNPNEREVNLLSKLQSDPQFFNLHDYTNDFLSKEKDTDHIGSEDKGEYILNFESKYKPTLGHYDSNGNFVFEPTDDLVDRFIKGNQHAAMSVAGLIPAKQANGKLGEGFTSEFKGDIKQQAREYLKAIAQQGFAPNIGRYETKMKPSPRATAADRKVEMENEEVSAIQTNLKNGIEETFDSYLGDHWQEFKYEKDPDGNIDTIIATYEDPKEDLRSRKIKTEVIHVNSDDFESVRNALNRIKKFKNKSTVSSGVLEKPKKSYKAPNGKTYTHQDLVKMGYTEEQINQALKAGSLK